MVGALEEKKVEITAVLQEGGIDDMTPMHLAVKSLDEASVQYLFEKQKGFGMDFWGRSPIHLAAIAQNVAIARTLLASDSRPDQADKFGRTPLNYLIDGKGTRTDDENLQKVA